jgi:hypothetical protein
MMPLSARRKRVYSVTLQTMKREREEFESTSIVSPGNIRLGLRPE